MNEEGVAIGRLKCPLLRHLSFYIGARGDCRIFCFIKQLKIICVFVLLESEILMSFVVCNQTNFDNKKTTGIFHFAGYCKQNKDFLRFRGMKKLKKKIQRK